jgi:hypothetical protein
MYCHALGRLLKITAYIVVMLVKVISYTELLRIENRVGGRGGGGGGNMMLN